jgi:DNA (cytosine-5)-methyltransferase 1
MAKKFIGLFSGAGGLDLGFQMAGWESVFLTDYWDPAVKTLENNNPTTTVKKFDVTNLDEKTLKTILPNQMDQIDAVIGGPPCQAFSRLNQNQLFKDGKETEFNTNDPRRSLFMDFLRVVTYIKPKFVVMENVYDIATRKLGGQGKDKGKLVVDIIKEEFDKTGYFLSYEVLNSKDFNVPQSRRRMIFIGTRKDLSLDPSLPLAEELKTSVRLEFEKIKPHHPNQEKKTPSKSVIQKIRHIPEGGYYNHLPTKMKVLKKVTRDFISSYDGQDRNFCFEDGRNLTEFRTVLKNGKVVKALFNDFECSKSKLLDKIKGKTIYRIMPRMGTYLRRINQNVSHTVTRNPLFHPSENRELTIREKAAIQTFPPEYEFYGTIGEQHILVGNAVPCNMAIAIAKHLENLNDIG